MKHIKAIFKFPSNAIFTIICIKYLIIYIRLNEGRDPLKQEYADTFFDSLPDEIKTFVSSNFYKLTAFAFNICVWCFVIKLIIF